MSGNFDRYRLDQARFEEIYREAIEKPALEGTSPPMKKPLAVFLGGQPGCGKSTAVRQCAAVFDTGEGFVHVDVDRNRELHPAYLPLVTNPVTERLAPSAVQRDCSAWADRLLAAGIENNRNLLVEGTLRAPAQVRVAADSVRAAGYESEARIIVAHEKTSEVALLHRFEHEKDGQGYGREIPFDYHSLAASGVVDSVASIEDEKLFDSLVLVDRRGKTIYENRLVNGEWSHPPRGAEVMALYRDISYNHEEKANIARLWDVVVEKMSVRGAPEAEMSLVKRMQCGAHFAADPALAAKRWPELRGTLEILQAKAIEALRDGLAFDTAVIRGSNLLGDAIAKRMSVEDMKQVDLNTKETLCREVRDRPSGGEYTGQVLNVGAGLTVQNAGRGSVVVHDNTRLSLVPDVGRRMEIRYLDSGVGVVNERGIDRNVGRGGR